MIGLQISVAFGFWESWKYDSITKIRYELWCKAITPLFAPLPSQQLFLRRFRLSIYRFREAFSETEKTTPWRVPWSNTTQKLFALLQWPGHEGHPCSDTQVSRVTERQAAIINLHGQAAVQHSCASHLWSTSCNSFHSTLSSRVVYLCKGPNQNNSFRSFKRQ